MFAAMAVQPGRTHGIDIGADVRDIFYVARIQPKAAAIVMGLHESHLCRALQGVKGYALDLWRLAELPEPVQQQLYDRVLLRVRGLRMAKADLETRKAGIA